MEIYKQKLIESISNLEKALNRLEEALHEDLDNSLIVDGTIQRFEFTFELFWQTLKRLLYSEGIDVRKPKSTLKEAYQGGWLNEEEAWLQMLNDRNLSSRTYNEEAAGQIIRNITGYFPEMKAVFAKIKSRTGEETE